MEQEIEKSQIKLQYLQIQYLSILGLPQIWANFLAYQRQSFLTTISHHTGSSHCTQR